MKSLNMRATVVAAAVALVALAVPAIAGATSAVNSGGKLLPVGTKITATGYSDRIESPTLSYLECDFTVNGELTKNDGKTVEFKAPLQKPVQTSECAQEGRPIEYYEMVFGFKSTTYPSVLINFATKLKYVEKKCTFTATELHANWPNTYTNYFRASNSTGLFGSDGCGGKSRFSGTFSLTETGTANKIFLH